MALGRGGFNLRGSKIQNLPPPRNRICCAASESPSASGEFRLRDHIFAGDSLPVIFA